MTEKKKPGTSPKKCACSVVAIAYAQPESRVEAETLAQHLRFDGKKKLALFVCEHGNEFPMQKVRS